MKYLNCLDKNLKFKIFGIFRVQKSSIITQKFKLIIFKIFFSSTRFFGHEWISVFCRTYHKMRDSHGSIYVGECDSKLRKHGYGHCYFENGDLYYGLWRKGCMDEYGCYWWEATGSIYVGHWQKGRRHGRGTVLFGPRHKEKAGLLQTSKWQKDLEVESLGSKIVKIY